MMAIVKGPLITVYLPTRNRAWLLRDAVQSVLVQTQTDFELIVVDDASSDQTQNVCEQFAIQDERVRVVRLESSRGAPAARNVAIGMARGAFITGIDDDDVMLPNRLATMLAGLGESDAFVCSSYWLEKNRNGRVRRTLLHRRARAISLDDLLYRNLVGNQLMTRTDYLRAVGGFDEKLVASQDYDLWTRLALSFGEGRRIANPTYVMRSGVASTSISSSEKFGLGARQYTIKHEAIMRPSQRRSQQLLHRITARTPIRLRDVGKCFAWPTAELMLRYVLSRSRGVIWVRKLLRA